MLSSEFLLEYCPGQLPVPVAYSQPLTYIFDVGDKQREWLGGDLIDPDLGIQPEHTEQKVLLFLGEVLGVTDHLNGLDPIHLHQEIEWPANPRSLPENPHDLADLLQLHRTEGTLLDPIVQDWHELYERVLLGLLFVDGLVEISIGLD